MGLSLVRRLLYDFELNAAQNGEAGVPTKRQPWIVVLADINAKAYEAIRTMLSAGENRYLFV